MTPGEEAKNFIICSTGSNVSIFVPFSHAPQMMQNRPRRMPTHAVGGVTGKEP